MRRTWVLIVLIVGASLAVLPLGVSGTDYGTYSGAALPVPAEVESNLEDGLRDFLEGTGYSYPGDLFVMEGQNGGVYVVATEGKIEAGIATVRGERLAKPDGDTYGVIVAEDVSIDRSSSATLTAREYNDSRSQYIGEIVEIEGHYRQAASVGEVESVVSKDQLGAIAYDALDVPITTTPGQTARSSLISTANGSGTRYADAVVQVATLHGEIVAVPRGYRQSAWWMSANASVRVLVLPEAFKTVGWNGNEHIIDIDVESTRTVSPATIQRHGEGLEWDVVTVRGQGVGSQISTQESLLAVAECAPESVTVPASPPLCVPLPIDMSIHSGAIATADQPTAIVPYVGLSNQHQDVPVTPEHGAYELTGRVVDASKLDPRLEGYGLIVYDRDRLGPLEAAGFESKLRERADNYTNIYQTQISMPESEYQEMEKAHELTPTPSPTMSPSPTASPEPTETDSPAPTDSPILRTDEVRETPTPTSGSGAGFTVTIAFVAVVLYLSRFE